MRDHIALCGPATGWYRRQASSARTIPSTRSMILRKRHAARQAGKKIEAGVGSGSPCVRRLQRLGRPHVLEN
jgi:hypothetical protein